MTVKATVIVPTFNHADTLLYSLPSVLNQTIQDIEVFVVGDGVPDRTRAIMNEIVQQDNRVDFFDFPKALRHGEEYRHQLLSECARGEIVCYLCDDDLWLPNHVETMLTLLSHADIAHTLPVVVNPDDSIKAVSVDLSLDIYKKLLLTCENRIPLIHFAHTLSFYKQLPYGWRVTPKHIPTDLYMFQQYIMQPHCRISSSKQVTAIHFDSVVRSGVGDEARLDELRLWVERLQAPGAYQALLCEVIDAMANSVISYEIQKKFSPMYFYCKKLLKIARRSAMVRRLSVN